MNKQINFPILFFDNIAKPKNIAKPAAACPDGNERRKCNSTPGIGFKRITLEFAKKVEGRGKLVILLSKSTIKKVIKALIPTLKKVEYLCNNARISNIGIPIPPTRLEENLKYSLSKFTRL